MMERRDKYVHLTDLEASDGLVSQEMVPFLLNEQGIGLVNLTIDGEIKAIVYPSKPIQKNLYLPPQLDLHIYLYSDAASFEIAIREIVRRMLRLIVERVDYQHVDVNAPIGKSQINGDEKPMNRQEELQAFSNLNGFFNQAVSVPSQKVVELVEKHLRQ